MIYPTSLLNCEVFLLGCWSPHWNRNDTENPEADPCELLVWPEASFYFSFFLKNVKHFTQVKLTLEAKIIRGIERRVKISLTFILSICIP